MQNEDLEIEEQKKTHRRANDALQYQVFFSILKAYERTLNLLKYTLIVIIITIALLYSAFTGDTTRNDYQVRMLNDILIKLDDVKKSNNIPQEDLTNAAKVLERIINISQNTKQCAACHNVNNSITIYSSWNSNDFKQYMRGTKRIPQNNIMPKYGPNDLSDLDIEKMYEILKDGR